MLAKTLELWVIRRNDIKYLEYEMNVKEKILISDLKAKTFITLIEKACVFYQLCAVYIYAQPQQVYFTASSFAIIIIQGYDGFLCYLRYENLKEYYRELDACLKKKIDVEEDCIICFEKLQNARVLSCNHFFHLICLSKWFENDKKCPICRKKITLHENPDLTHPNNHVNLYTFVLRLINTTLNSWFPNISLRIVRINTNTVSTDDNRRNYNH